MSGKRLDDNDIISDYVEHKFTLKELSVKHNFRIGCIAQDPLEGLIEYHK